jgi:hypothetical protein
MPAARPVAGAASHDVGPPPVHRGGVLKGEPRFLFLPSGPIVADLIFAGELRLFAGAAAGGILRKLPLSVLRLLTVQFGPRGLWRGLAIRRFHRLGRGNRRHPANEGADQHGQHEPGAGRAKIHGKILAFDHPIMPDREPTSSP